MGVDYTIFYKITEVGIKEPKEKSSPPPNFINYFFLGRKTAIRSNWRKGALAQKCARRILEVKKQL